MKTFCINLSRRKDKWAYVQEEFKRIGLSQVIRFDAINKSPGWVGCRESHLEIMRMCKGDDQFIIFEDDVRFLFDKKQSLLTIALAVSELPADWDCLYLGASPRRLQVKYSDHLYKLNDAVCAHAIAWHNRKNGVVEFILSNASAIRKIDDYFATIIQPNFNCFAVYPMVVTQKQFDSDTCKRSDVSTIEKNYKQFCDGR